MIRFPAAPLLGLLAGVCIALSLPAPTARGAEGLKIGTVNMNRALNVSDAGNRSRTLLLASKSQKENELKEKELALKKIQEELTNNILLTEAARAQKQLELKSKGEELRTEVQNAQRELQKKEIQMTESLFGELKTVISLIAKEQKFDLVLDQGVARAILFSRFKMVDLTDQVILRFNKPN